MTKELKKFYSFLQFIITINILFIANSSQSVPVYPNSNNYTPTQTAPQLKQSNKQTAIPQAFNNPVQQNTQTNPQKLSNATEPNDPATNDIIKERVNKQKEQEKKSWEEIVQQKNDRSSFIDTLIDINYSDKHPPKVLYTRTQTNANHHLPPVYFKSYYLSIAFKASEINDVNSVNAILRKFNFLNGQNKEGDTLLMHSIQYNSLDVARSLIAKGAFLDAVNNRKRTALHYAATLGDYETTKLLLSMGSDFTLMDDNKMTALDYAKANNNQHVVATIDQYYKYNSIRK